MKRTFINFLVAALIVGNISSVQAATNDNSNVSNNSSSTTTTNNESAIRISLSNIKDIILENNQQAKIYENTEKNQKLSYDSAKDTRDSKDSAYESAKSEYEDDLATWKSDPVNNTEPSYSTVTNAKNALEEAEADLDDARQALKKAKITYNKNIQNLVKTAQNDYISYILNDLPNKEYNTANVQLLKKKADIAKIQYDSGFLSKDDYTNAQLKYTSAINTSNTTNDKEKNDKAALLYDLGISSEEKVTFVTNIEQDLKDVSAINYDNDLTQMLGNNLTLQEDKMDIDDASDKKEEDEDNDEDDNTIDKDKNALESAQAQLVLDQNNAEKNFKIKYDALMNSYATMKSSYDSLEQQKKNYNVAQIQYDYGFASQQSVDETKVTLLNSSQSFEKDKSTFYENYLSYIEMKEGY